MRNVTSRAASAQYAAADQQCQTRGLAGNAHSGRL